MTTQNKVTSMKLIWARLIVGTSLAFAMLYVHAYVKDLDSYLFFLPGVLLGLDPQKVINMIKSK